MSNLATLLQEDESNVFSSYPIYTNLMVIAFCYAAIAPLVLGFAAIGLYFFYFAFRYNFMFVSNANIDVSISCEECPSGRSLT